MKTEQQKAQEIVDNCKNYVNPTGYNALTSADYVGMILSDAKDLAKHIVQEILEGFRMMEERGKNSSKSINFFSGVFMRIDFCE